MALLSPVEVVLGTWSGTVADIADVAGTPNDATALVSPLTPTASDVVKIRVAPAEEGYTPASATFTVRFAKSAAEGDTLTGWLEVRNEVGSTIVATRQVSANITENVSAYSFSLTPTERALVTNWGALWVWWFSAVGSSDPIVVPPGDHGYFDALVASSAHWKSLSFRPQVGAPINTPHYEHQLKYPSRGGYLYSSSYDIPTGMFVSYSPSTDTDPHAQEATKIIIPAFKSTYVDEVLVPRTLVGDIDDEQTTITVTPAITLDGGNALLIDNEIVTVPVAVAGVTTLTVVRGQEGTVAAPHLSGTTFKVSTNSLPSQVRFPLGATTATGTFLITWDVYFTDSWLEPDGGVLDLAYKTFQIAGNSATEQWLEVRHRPDGWWGAAEGWDHTIHAGSVDTRHYNIVQTDPTFTVEERAYGLTKTDGDPMLPKEGYFNIVPNRWTRFWAHLQMSTTDWDIYNLWVADEVQDPAHVYVNKQVAEPYINNFWVEFNESENSPKRCDLRDLVTYVRNFVVLQNPLPIESYLIKPAA